MPDSEAALPPAINNVAIKLPEFWTTNPALWFKQVEAAFRRGRVTVSATKYDHVLVKLPIEVLDSVADVVNAIDDDTVDPYEQLKARLISDYGLSKWQRAARIIDHPGLGDSRPSALMSQLLSLLPPDEKPGTLFMHLFLRHLPADMRSVLVAAKIENPRELAVQADLLWDARGTGGAANAVVGRQSSPSPLHGRTRSHRHRKRSGTPDGLCFYHGRFGKQALRCQSPCTWSGNLPAAGSN